MLIEKPFRLKCSFAKLCTLSPLFHFFLCQLLSICFLLYTLKLLPQSHRLGVFNSYRVLYIQRFKVPINKVWQHSPKEV